MNQSLWCVTAVVALGALACSDPVPPPAQGTFLVSVQGVSPTPTGKFCPGVAFSYEAPDKNTTSSTDEGPTPLSDGTRIIDGESRSGVSCTVKGKTTFTFNGSISYGNTSLSISGGTVGADGKGTARVAIEDGPHLGAGTGLASAVGACTIDATSVPGVQNYQIQPGSMWAHFSCDAVENPPSALCRAQGVFIFENCIKD